MTAIGASAWDIILDGLKVMGLCTVLCFIYHLVALLLPFKNKAFLIVLHIIEFSVFGFLIFCFILGETVSKSIRWTMIAGMFAAAAVYFVAMAPAVDSAADAVGKFIAKLLSPFVAAARASARFIKNIAVHLKKRCAMLYNSNRSNYTSRIKSRRKRNGGNKKHKTERQPIKIHTQA